MAVLTEVRKTSRAPSSSLSQSLDAFALSGTVSLGDTAYVYDDDGCLIGTEELSALVDRTGWATAFVTGESEEEALCCHWSLDGLCCPPTG